VRFFLLTRICRVCVWEYIYICVLRGHWAWAAPLTGNVIERNPPPRGGFFVGRFANQEPGGSGPQVKIYIPTYIYVGATYYICWCHMVVPTYIHPNIYTHPNICTSQYIYIPIYIHPNNIHPNIYTSMLFEAFEREQHLFGNLVHLCQCPNIYIYTSQYIYIPILYIPIYMHPNIYTSVLFEQHLLGNLWHLCQCQGAFHFSLLSSARMYIYWDVYILGCIYIGMYIYWEVHVLGYIYIALFTVEAVEREQLQYVRDSW